MDVSLVLYAEHDFNASTFTSRVVASTNSDLHSSVCAAIGALKGNLHGGANEAAMDMLNEIMADTKDGALDVDAWMQRARCIQASTSRAPSLVSAMISFSMSMAASLAPPWRLPLRAPIAAHTEECRSELVEATTRLVKVEALKSCSA